MHYLQREDEPNILRTMKNNGYEVIWIGRNDVIPGNRPKTEYCDKYYNGLDFENHRDDVNSSLNFGKRVNNFKVPGFMENNRYYSFYLGEMDQAEAANTFDWNCVKTTLDYLDKKSTEPAGKPFFLYVTISFPHPPYACEEPWFSSIDRDSLPVRRTDVEKLKDKPSMLHGIRSKQNLQNWSEDQYNELRSTYLAMVSRFDYQYGLIADQLKKLNMYDSTNIFVYSDHGDYTGDYGIVEKVQNCFENPVSNVPLMIKPAAGINVKPGKSKVLTELLDIPATVAQMAGIELDYVQFGKSLVPALEGAKFHKDAVFCEGGRIHGEVWAMEGGHKPDSLYWPRLSTQSQEGPEHTKAVMVRMDHYKYVKRLYEKDEFYNLDADPHELYNEIDNEDYKEIIFKIKMRLLDFYMETADTIPNKKDLR